MAMTVEKMVARFGVSRFEQDEFVVRSQRLAGKAVSSGLFDPEIVPITVKLLGRGTDGRACRTPAPRCDAGTTELTAPCVRPAWDRHRGGSSRINDAVAGTGDDEAFAAHAVDAIRDTGIVEIVNPSGGAVALGHPVGAAGAILPLELIYHMRRK